MGTRIHVYLTHDLEDFEDAAEILSRLELALPAALAVREYWRTVDPDNADADIDGWTAGPKFPRLFDKRIYYGPGSLELWLTSRAARIGTGGRWRGFLSIEPLRRVHLTGFRAIAIALHSPSLAICHDSCDEVDDVFLENRPQQDCIDQLHAVLGPPQPSIEVIAPGIIAKTEHGVPAVWYLDRQGGDR